MRYFLLLLFMLSTLHAYDFKTSLIIPCYHGHFDFLTPLLECYALQTSLPDEVVISLSEADRVDSEKLQAFCKKKWPFPVRLIKSNKHYFAGENRNIAALASKGELIVCQDADDLPHRRRLEVIKWFYNETHFDHLMHSWMKFDEELQDISIDDIPHYFPEFHIHVHTKVHHGNCAIARRVLNRVRWGDRWKTQDVIFCRSVYMRFPRKVVLEVPLIYYLPERGSRRERIEEAIRRGQWIEKEEMEKYQKQRARGDEN